MRIKQIIVGYGQTIPGNQYESERYDMSITFETETEKEKDIANLKKLGRRLQEEVIKNVEKASGRVMRRRKEDDE